MSPYINASIDDIGCTFEGEFFLRMPSDRYFRFDFIGKNYGGRKGADESGKSCWMQFMELARSEFPRAKFQAWHRNKLVSVP